MVPAYPPEADVDYTQLASAQRARQEAVIVRGEEGSEADGALRSGQLTRDQVRQLRSQAGTVT